MADVLAVRDAYRAQQWEMVVQECAASGLSNREFCRQRGIPEKSFYYWQRKLRQQIVEAASPQLVPLEPVTEPGGSASDSVPGCRAEIACRCGHGCGCCFAPLAPVAMIDLSKVRNFYVACGYTDLRYGIDGLAAVVTQQFGGHLDEESLFLFCGRRTDRIKALYWSGDGYVLLYKRLSNGRFQWPRSEAELRLLDPQSFRWLMEGLRIEQKTAIRKGKPKDLF